MKPTIIIALAGLGTCLSIGRAFGEGSAQAPWIPSVALIHSSVTNAPLYWPPDTNNLILPAYIGVRQTTGVVTTVDATYSTNDVSFEQLRDAIDAMYRPLRISQTQPREAKWILRDEEVVISLFRGGDHSSIAIVHYAREMWRLPIFKGKFSAEQQGGGYSPPAARPAQPTP